MSPFQKILIFRTSCTHSLDIVYTGVYTVVMSISIREFRANLKQYLDALRSGEVLEVGDLKISKYVYTEKSGVHMAEDKPKDVYTEPARQQYQGNEAFKKLIATVPPPEPTDVNEFEEEVPKFPCDLCKETKPDVYIYEYVWETGDETHLCKECIQLKHKKDWMYKIKSLKKLV